MEHSKLAPSSASRRLACPGSRSLEQRYPQLVSSSSSIEGTAAHWVAQQFLEHGSCAFDKTPDGELITPEMLEGADLYEHTVKHVSTTGLHIEERVSISTVHPDCWGTPDCWTVVGDNLTVFDYKFGHGYIEVFENWQLLEYAAGIISGLDNIATITMTIVQPRCYCPEGPVRSWVISAEELNGYIEKLRVSEAKSMEESALCVPGPECCHCRGRHACSALQNSAATFSDMSGGNTPHELDSRQTAWEIKYLRKAAAIIDARLTALEEQAKYLISRGDYVPGFKLEPASSREYWTKDVIEVITLGEMMGIDLSKPQDVITPTQARKLGLPDDVISSYAQRVAGKLKLVEDKNARKIFKK